MREKELIQIVSGNVSPYTFLTSMMAAVANRNSELTPEERAERKEKRRLYFAEQARQAKIIKNICPDCDGKLVRGKKDKKNDYKRIWTCKDCGNSHSA